MNPTSAPAHARSRSIPTAETSEPAAASPSGSLGHDELIRVFNTALVATQAGGSRDFSSEIFEMIEAPAFRAILGAIKQYARLQGLGERQAAEQIITTFRKMDRLWTDYVFQEGVDRIKASGK